ncbi:MAG TPA: hypothetical protein VKU19_35040 [Bryobacteraceae bacterium]|nr:hypothetical protein [Bryobacteraceae bacterium]
MVHVLSPIRSQIHTAATTRKPATPAATTTATTTSDTGAADFKAIFTPKVSSTPSTGTLPATVAPVPAPTAESVFGPSPWVSNPTGVGPNGATYSYNPYYFASADTAAKVAQMVGGTVVQSNQLTGNGGAFSQNQPNLMVQLPNGHLINPGLVASFYTHGYPQSYVDQMVASEAANV